MRAEIFGPTAGTRRNRRRLEADIPGQTHVDADIRDGMLERMSGSRVNETLGVAVLGA